jgi:ADP-ribose/FAD diphosphatase
MAFCRQCGQPVVRQWVEADARERAVCGSCRCVDYENPHVLVACFIHWADKIVLCRRAADPGKGCWYLPIGYMEAGETPEEAAARELREEVGLAVPSSSFLLYEIVSLPHINQVYIAYRAALPARPHLTPGREALAAGIFAESELPGKQLAFDDASVGFIRTFFRRLRSGFLPVRSLTLGRDTAAPAPAELEDQENADRR